MSETTLEDRLMGIPLSANKPMENYEKLRNLLMTDSVLNKTLDNCIAQQSETINHPHSIVAFKRNTIKLIIAHVLYQRFEKYRDKQFGPALLAYGTSDTRAYLSSKLNKDLDNIFLSVYGYFYHKNIDINQVIQNVNPACNMNITYIKKPICKHFLPNNGITNQKFLELYNSYRTELMQDSRVNTIQEEANKLLNTPELHSLKKSFIEGMFNIIIGHNILNTIKKYTNDHLYNRDSQINVNFERIFSRANNFFKNHEDIFGDYGYAYDFLEHCGFNVTLNQDNPWNHTQNAGKMYDFVDTTNGQDTNLNKNSMISLKIVYKYLNDLTERERTVIESRYGLNGKTCTLKDIAFKYGLTKERIRQIELKSLYKLRSRIEAETKHVNSSSYVCNNKP